MKQHYVYIMSNPARTLYAGMNNLERRVYERKHGLVPGFTSTYKLTQLVYFESTSDVTAAIAREKQIKEWVRQKKIARIRAMNPEWHDLSAGWFGATDSSLRSA